MDGEIDEALEKWNAEEEKKQFEATWNSAHAAVIESKEQNRSDHDGSNISADYYGDGSSWSSSSSIRRGKGAPQVALEDEQSKETEKRKLLRWYISERIVSKLLLVWPRSGSSI